MEVMKSQYENKLLVSIFIYSVPLIVFRSNRQVNKILRTYLLGENPRMIEAFVLPISKSYLNVEDTFFFKIYSSEYF